METDYSQAEELYKVYGESVDWKNFMGEKMPEFEELTARIKNAWLAVADAKWAFQSNWRDQLPTRQVKIIQNAEDYSLDAFGDVAHELKLTLSRLAGFLDDGE